MSAGEWIIAFLVVYFLVAALWIKGTDAQSSDGWMFTWKIVKFILLCIFWPVAIILVFSWLVGGKDRD